MSNPIDELEALFAEVRRPPSPHSYVSRRDPHAVCPDTKRLIFDADRFRWLFTQPDPIGLLQNLAADIIQRGRPFSLPEWRAWFDARMTLEVLEKRL